MRRFVVSGSVLCAVGLSGSAFGAGTLVGHWKFNEAPGATSAADSGPNGFTGTLAGSAAFVAGGVDGNAIDLSVAGNSYVEMLPVPFNSSPFSLSAWVKTTDAAHAIVAGKHVSTIVQGYFLAMNSGGGYGAPGKAYSYVSTFPGGVPISVTTVNDGQWHHLLMTHTPGGSVTIFVDGTLETAIGAPPYAASPAPFMVGGIVNPANQRISAYTGLADDVQLYDGTLTGAQICAIVNNPGVAAPVSCDGDVNIDRTVSFADLNIVLSNFGQAGFCLPGDADGDGQVNFADLNIVLSAFGQSC